MAEYQDREHYIPLRKTDLVELLCKDAKLTDTREREAFRQFGKLVSAIWHFEYLDTLDKLKDAYALFDPDTATQPLAEVPKEQRPPRMEQLFDRVVQLMERANFQRLSKEDIQAAVDGGASDWGINMHVDWDVFERLELFVRSEGNVKRTKRHAVFFWQTTEKQVDTYKRLIVLVKLRKHKRIPPAIDTDRVYVKMFKDVPKLDLEMVLPGTSLQMPLFQKLKLSGSVVGTLGYGIFSLASKLMVAIYAIFNAAVTFAISAAEFALFAPFFVLFGYGYKQWAGYQVTKQTYAKMLVESLYYQNIGNNLCVITDLVDEAEEQECRETLLAYFYLWKYAPAEGWTKGQIDDYVELELEGKLGLKVDFEVEDALAKLEKLNIVTRSGDKYRAVGMAKALEVLDYRWDNYFTYNQR